MPMILKIGRYYLLWLKYIKVKMSDLVFTDAALNVIKSQF